MEFPTFAEYFFYLLHRVFKRTVPENSDADKLSKALGPNFDEAKDVIFQLREQSLVLTATGKALDALGKDRGLPRYREEIDDQYRLRLLAAYSIWSQVGTPAAMTKALQTLGFDNIEIKELRQEDPARWAEFEVKLGLSEPTFTEAQRANVQGTIGKMKPAHTAQAALNIQAPARDAGADPDVLTWGETLVMAIFPCPLPADELYPAEDLYPC